jgi:hypothetical protein
MPRGRSGQQRPYPPELRQQMLELVRSGQSPEKLETVSCRRIEGDATEHDGARAYRSQGGRVARVASRRRGRWQRG